MTAIAAVPSGHPVSEDLRRIAVKSWKAPIIFGIFAVLFTLLPLLGPREGVTLTMRSWPATRYSSTTSPLVSVRTATWASARSTAGSLAVEPLEAHPATASTERINRAFMATPRSR